MTGLRFLEELLGTWKPRETRLDHLVPLAEQVGAPVVALISDTQQGWVAHASDAAGSPLVRIASSDPEAACKALEAALRALVRARA